MALKYVEIFYPNDGVIPNYAIISGEIQRDLGRRFSVRIAPLDLEDKKEFLWNFCKISTSPLRRNVVADAEIILLDVTRGGEKETPNWRERREND